MGCRIGEHLPLLAQQADRFNLIRSVRCAARNDHSPGLHLLLRKWENVAAWQPFPAKAKGRC